MINKRTIDIIVKPEGQFGQSSLYPKFHHFNLFDYDKKSLAGHLNGISLIPRREPSFFLSAHKAGALWGPHFNGSQFPQYRVAVKTSTVITARCRVTAASLLSGKQRLKTNPICLGIQVVYLLARDVHRIIAEQRVNFCDLGVTTAWSCQCRWRKDQHPGEPVKMTQAPINAGLLIRIYIRWLKPGLSSLAGIALQLSLLVIVSTVTNV